MVLLSAVIYSHRSALPLGWENSSIVCGLVYCGRVSLLHLLFDCVGPQFRVNVSAGLGKPLSGVSPPLEVAPLLVVAPLEVSPPLEVAPLTRSRGLSVVQVWVQLVLGYKQGGFGGGELGGILGLLS